MIRNFTPLLLILAAATACGDKNTGECPPPVSTEELYPCAHNNVLLSTVQLSEFPVFNHDLIIRIPSYTFNDNGTVVPVRGDAGLTGLIAATDCCSAAEAMDVLPAEPQLAWEFFPNELIAAAIFGRNIELEADGASIANVEDAVWLWNSGMAGANSANNLTRVDFTDGRDVVDGQVLDTVTPLQPGRIYQWMVWAWNEAGTQIVASSRALPFIVGGLPTVPITDYHQVLGRWETDEVRTLDGSADLTAAFPYSGFVVTEKNCTPEGLPVLDYRLLPYGLPTEVMMIDDFSFSTQPVGDIESVENMELICDDLLRAEVGFNGKIGRATFRRVE